MRRPDNALQNLGIYETPVLVLTTEAVGKTAAESYSAAGRIRDDIWKSADLIQFVKHELARDRPQSLLDTPPMRPSAS
jgi:hypothetical protein